MKKKYFGIACLLGAFLVLGVPSTVYAGDINAAEQELINYYSGIFYYEGKAYRATSEAISQARAKLMQDDVNLSMDQVVAAKYEIQNSVKKGIDQGYLVEVTEDGEPKDPDDTEEEEGTDPSTDPVKDGESQTSEEKIRNDDSLTDPAGGGESQEGNNPGKSDGEKEENGKKNRVKNIGEKIDMDPLIKRVGKDNNLVIVNGESSFTIQDYTNGQIISVTEEGVILYQGELPIKNTGYQSKNLILWATMLIGIFLCNLIAVIVFIRRGKGDRHGA